jgi:AbrB family looped-hinge helix DNA binding protein
MQLGELPQTWPATVDTSGRVLIPAPSRHELGWEPGTHVVVVRDGDGIRILSLDEYTREVQEFFRGAESEDVIWSEELIRQRRAEAARDNEGH